MCQIFNTLIGDEDHVYDLNLLDDQLVLGIKGTMSVVELKVLQMRMLRGQEEKARRGELLKRLPAGYERDIDGNVMITADVRVREAIELIFKKFREVRTIRQAFQWFRDHDVELPVNPARGGNQLIWQIPTQAFVGDVLVNPFYAGAYVWGRRPVETVLVDGQLKKATRTLAATARVPRLHPRPSRRIYYVADLRREPEDHSRQQHESRNDRSDGRRA